MNVKIRQSDAPAVTASRDPCQVAAAAAWGLALAVLAVAYLVIAAYTGNPFPWFEVVHESGDRTLLQTVFFFEHTARELPLDLILGAAVGSCALFACPPGPEPESGKASCRSSLAIGLLLVIVVIVVGTLRVGGWPMLEENLLQFPTRPGAPREWGGHWRYHLLSHVTLMSVSLGLAAVLVLWDRGPQWEGTSCGRQDVRDHGCVVCRAHGHLRAQPGSIRRPCLHRTSSPGVVVARCGDDAGCLGHLPDAHQVQASCPGGRHGSASLGAPDRWRRCARWALPADQRVGQVRSLTRTIAESDGALVPTLFRTLVLYVVAGLTAGLVYVSTGEDRERVVRR